MANEGYIKGRRIPGHRGKTSTAMNKLGAEKWHADMFLMSPRHELIEVYEAQMRKKQRRQAIIEYYIDHPKEVNDRTQ